MRALILTTAVLLAGCGQGSGVAQSASAPDAAPPDLDVSTLAQTVTRLETAQTPSGLIVSAIALPPTQGFWDAALEPIDDGDPTTRAYAFRLLPPVDAEGAGAPPTREVLAGTYISNQDLDGAATITVRGRANVLATRR